MGPRKFIGRLTVSDPVYLMGYAALPKPAATCGPDWTKIETYWPHLAARKGV